MNKKIAKKGSMVTSCSFLNNSQLGWKGTFYQSSQNKFSLENISFQNLTFFKETLDWILYSLWKKEQTRSHSNSIRLYCYIRVFNCILWCGIGRKLFRQNFPATMAAAQVAKKLKDKRKQRTIEGIFKKVKV